MKKLAIFCFSFIFVALFSVAAAAQENTNKPEEKKDEKNPLVANWEVTFAAPGQNIPGTFKLEKDGENYKGSVLTDLGEAPLKNIKIKDNTFTADITVNVQGQTMDGTMNGKLEAEKLSGELNLPGFPAITYTGKKPEKK
jgi:hypothetical protein